VLGPSTKGSCNPTKIHIEPRDSYESEIFYPLICKIYFDAVGKDNDLLTLLSTKGWEVWGIKIYILYYIFIFIIFLKYYCIFSKKKILTW